MCPDTPQTPDRAAYGGEGDRWQLDFGTVVNPDRPAGITAVYDSALAAARRYPRDDYAAFRIAAAERFGCEAAHVVPTPGRGAGIRLAAETFLSEGDRVLLPSPSLSLYTQEVQRQGARAVYRPVQAFLDEDPSEFDLVLAGIPHNPTGEVYDTDRLLAFLERCRVTDTLLVLDETLLGLTSAETLAGTPGVVVVRELMRAYGLAGLRAGVLIARGDHRMALDSARPPSTLSRPSAMVATHCLRQSSFLAESREWLASERAFLRTRLAPGYSIRQSAAPFLLLDVGDLSVDCVLRTARGAGVCLRDARTFHGLDNHVRVSVRKRDANEQLLAALPGVEPEDA
jgi:histidinol-phosphate/aromatic aminotransferase/cobyric acid decarboxylase-like protein